MVSHTYTLSKKAKGSIWSFMLGMSMGMVLQFSLQSTRYEARLLNRPASTVTITANSSLPAKPSLRQQRLAQRILRRNLRAAKRQSVRTTIVADNTLRRAAPPEPGVSRVPVTESNPSPNTHSASSSSSSLSSSSSSSSLSSFSSQSSTFPSFIRAVFPLTQTPDWGTMRTPAEWERPYEEMDASDFVAVPAYNLRTLTIPMQSLASDLTPDNMSKITAKLFYSTRFFGSYDVDSGEFEAVHPGLDLKVAEGTPVGAIAGGKVVAVRRDDSSFGLYILIEHRLSDDERWLSLYGHMQTAIVHPGDAVLPGQMIGRSGSTGNSSAPHLHLQIERLTGDADTHEIYWPSSVPSTAEAALHVIHPITFFEKYKRMAQ